MLNMAAANYFQGYKIIIFLNRKLPLTHRAAGERVHPPSRQQMQHMCTLNYS
jgi:hypothetical protein